MNQKDKKKKKKDPKIEKVKLAQEIALKELEHITFHREELQIIELILHCINQMNFWKEKFSTK